MCIYFGVSAAEHGLFLVAASGVSTLVVVASLVEEQGSRAHGLQ